MNYLVVLFSLCSLFLGNTTGYWLDSEFRDPCTLHHERGNPHEINELYSLPNCTYGAIWWSFPQGKLRVHFTSGHLHRNFRVCLAYKAGPNTDDLKQVLDLSGAKPRGIHINEHHDDGEDCGYTVAEEVTLQFEEPTVDTFLMSFQYRLDFED